jgi:hypothetical protein
MNTLKNWTIKTFKIVGDYTIQITFSDGTQKNIDFEPVIGKSWMKELKDKKYFAQVTLNDGGNLEWHNGQDFNPEALYDWDNFKSYYIQELNQE